MTEANTNPLTAVKGAEPTARAGAREIMPVLGMAVLFLASIGLALAVTPTFDRENVQAFEDPDSLANPLIYLVIVVLFTLLILWIARKGLKRIIRYIILGAVFFTILYIFAPLLRQVIGDTPAFVVSLAAGAGLVALLYYYPEWWVIDAAGVVVSAGSAAIFGVSFGILPALLLLTGFAIYDAIAVYRTKHMLDLADSVLELRLPIMFVVPKSRGYSFLAETRRLKEQLETKEERDAMFMGLGDAVIPGVLVVSAFHFLARAPANVESVLGMAPALAVALATLLGSFVGYAALMWYVLKGNPHAGLPLLNGGAIVGFFLALVPLYGLAPVWPFG